MDDFCHSGLQLHGCREGIRYVFEIPIYSNICQPLHLNIKEINEILYAKSLLFQFYVVSYYVDEAFLLVSTFNQANSCAMENEGITY